MTDYKLKDYLSKTETDGLDYKDRNVRFGYTKGGAESVYDDIIVRRSTVANMWGLNGQVDFGGLMRWELENNGVVGAHDDQLTEKEIAAKAKIAYLKEMGAKYGKDFVSSNAEAMALNVLINSGNKEALDKFIEKNYNLDGGDYYWKKRKDGKIEWVDSETYNGKAIGKFDVVDETTGNIKSFNNSTAGIMWLFGKDQAGARSILNKFGSWDNEKMGWYKDGKGIVIDNQQIVADMGKVNNSGVKFDFGKILINTLLRSIPGVGLGMDLIEMIQNNQNKPKSTVNNSNSTQNNNKDILSSK